MVYMKHPLVSLKTEALKTTPQRAEVEMPIGPFQRYCMFVQGTDMIQVIKELELQCETNDIFKMAYSTFVSDLQQGQLVMKMPK